MINLYPLPICDGLNDKLSALIKFVLDFNPRLLTPIVDGGAGIGDTTSDFLNISPEIKVYAYEPLARNVEILMKRFAGNSQVEIRGVALNKEDRSVVLLTPSRLVKASGQWGSGSSYNSYIRKERRTIRETLGAIRRGMWHSDTSRIRGIKLDTEPFIPDVIKLDLQGGEFNALLGGLGKLDYVKIIQLEQLLFENNLVLMNFPALDILMSKSFILHFGAIQFETKLPINHVTIDSLIRLGFTNIRHLKNGEFSSGNMVICQFTSTGVVSIDIFSNKLVQILNPYDVKYIQMDVIGINSNWKDEWENQKILC